MARLNIGRQLKLEPKRMKKALDEISGLGYIPIQVNETKLQFEFNGKVINYFPYSGWASGATIKDGRGLKNLLRQIC